MSDEGDDDFAEVMRRIRGDFGACAHCGSAFGEHEVTVKDSGREHRAVHPGCVLVGVCAGCETEVTKRDHRTMHDGRVVHAECVLRAVEKAKLREEREAAAMRSRMASHKRSELIRQAVADAHGGHTVALVTSPSNVETLASSFLGAHAKLAANRPAQKAISFSDHPGMVIVESSEPSNIVDKPPGYHAAYVLREALKREGETLLKLIAVHFNLAPEKIKVEEEV